MKLSTQIVSRFAAVPVLFAAAVGLSTALALRVREEVRAVAGYHIPVAQHIAGIDVATGDYELTVSRLLSPPRPDPDELARVLETLTSTRASIASALADSRQLLDEAVSDDSLDVEERVALADLRGIFRMLGRSAEPFLQLGDGTVSAWREGQALDAGKIKAQFAELESDINLGLTSLRGTLAAVEDRSVVRVRDSLAMLWHIGIGLFVLAAILGVVLGVGFARRLTGRLRQLVDASKSAGEKEYDVVLPPAGDDEVGDLTRAFDGMLGKLREEKKTNEAFGRYLDPRIVSHVVASGGDIGEYAERRAVSILFADIAGFTGLAEQLTAETLVRLLNRVFTGAADAIQGHSGIVDKYIGDAVMAFFMPPFTPGDGHASAACLAAIDHLTALKQMGPDLAALIGLRRGAPRISMRVGIATGEVVVGTLGSATARSFTVIGDAVNAASRITGVTRVYGAEIFVAEDTWRLAQGALEGREVDRVVLSGKSEPVTLYEVLGRAGEAQPADLERCEAYGKALAAYRAQRFQEAEQAFAGCLRIDPNDGPAQVMRNRSAQFALAPPLEDWDAVFYLGGK